MATPIVRVRQQSDGLFSVEAITMTVPDRGSPISVVDHIQRSDNLTFDQLAAWLRQTFPEIANS